MNQEIFSKNTLGRSRLYIHALSIILTSLIIQICCSLIPFGHWVGKAEGLAGDPWKAQYPPVEASYLNDIWAVSDDNIFAVGFNINGSFIGHYDGQDWKYMEASVLGEPFAELKGIWGNSENDIYAVGGMNDTETLIFHYNGFEWSVVDHNFSGYLFDIWGSGPDDVFAVGMEGLIIHWDGDSWNEMDSGTSLFLEGVWGDGQNKVFAVGEDSILLYENNSWSTLSGIPACYYLTDVWGIPGGDVFAVGDCILQYHEGQWSDVTPYNEFDDFQLYKIVGKSENEIMTVGAVGSMRVGYILYGEEGLIIKCDGQTWQIEDNPQEGLFFPADLNAAWIGDQGNAIVVGGSVYYDSYYYKPPTSGNFLSFNGLSWSVETSEEYYNGTLYQIWASSSHDIYAVGGYPYDWGDAYYLPEQKLARSFIAHFDGHKWSRVEVEEDGVLYDIWGSNGELFAVGGEIAGDEESGWDFIGGQILHSSDGVNWQIMDNDFEGFFHGVWGSSPQNVFAIGNSFYDLYGKIYRFNGNTWDEMGEPFYDMELRDVWGYDENNIFVVGWDWNEEEKGIILYYDGTGWTIMNSDICKDLYRVWGTSPNDVFAAGASGIYHYNGDTWSQSFSGGYFDDVWGTSHTDVFAIGDDGILHYNGVEWQDTGYIPVHDPDPEGGRYLFGIGGTSSDDVYIVGDYGRIYHYEKEQSGRQKILLREGWNLISFQINVCLHENETPPDVPLPEGIEFRQVGDMLSWLSDGVTSPIRDAQNPALAGDWQRITSYDLNNAHMVGKGNSTIFNDLDYLAAGYGYWIKMNAPGYLLLEGSLLQSSVSLSLREGWNLIGSLSPDICYYDDTVLYDGEDKPSCIVSEIPPVTFEPVTGGLVQRVFDSIDGKYRRVTAFYCDFPKMYDTQVPAFFCDLYYQAPGCGYWIKMTAEGTLTSP